MAFDLQGFGRSSSTMNGNSVIMWTYKSSVDDMDTINGSDYFASISNRLTVEDRIVVSGTDGRNTLVIASKGPVVTERDGNQSFTFVTTTDAGSAFGVQAISFHISMAGNMVTISWTQTTAAPTQATDIRVLAFPTVALPATQSDTPITVFDNNVETLGQLQIDVGGLLIFSNTLATGTAFTFPGATVGISSGSITYDKTI